MDGDGRFFMTTQEKQALYRTVRQEIQTCCLQTIGRQGKSESPREFHQGEDSDKQLNIVKRRPFCDRLHCIYRSSSFTTSPASSTESTSFIVPSFKEISDRLHLPLNGNPKIS